MATNESDALEQGSGNAHVRLPSGRPGMPRFSAATWIGLAVIFAIFLSAFVESGRLEWIVYNLTSAADGLPYFLRAIWDMFCWGLHAFVALLAFGIGSVTILLGVIRLSRGAAAGSARDPVIGLRNLLRKHAKAGRQIASLPGTLLSPLAGIMVARAIEHDWPQHHGWVALLGFPVGFLLEAAAVRMFVRSLLAGLERTPDRLAEAAPTIEHGETRFLAVAVTARTKGAVLGMTLASLAMVLTVARSDHFLLRDTAVAFPLVAYIVAVLGFAAWFRQASTIAVGRDGIFVRGTSRERFYPYQQIDEARLRGASLDLIRGGTRVARLQLHGPDVTRGEALVERIRAALEMSRRTDGAHLLASVAAGNDLARGALGAADYRRPAVTREQLWDLVEGEATEAAARTAAAGALAASLAGEDRARLRIAATHCAEPRVRVALEALADEDELDVDSVSSDRIERLTLSPARAASR